MRVNAPQRLHHTTTDAARGLPSKESKKKKNDIEGVVHVSRTQAGPKDGLSEASLDSSSDVADSTLSTAVAYNPQIEDATSLVDGLLEYTNSLMDGDVPTRDDKNDHQHRHHIIAFSGGIDSSVVGSA